MRKLQKEAEKDITNIEVGRGMELEREKERERERERERLRERTGEGGRQRDIIREGDEVRDA